MSADDIKQLKELLKSEVKPLHGELARIRREISDSKMEKLKVGTALHKVETELTRVDSTLDTLSEKIDAQTVDIIDLQQTAGAIWDKISLETDRAEREIQQIKDHLGLSTV